MRSELDSNYKNSDPKAKKHAFILKRYEKDRTTQQPVRDERIPDLAFARWSQNDDDLQECIGTNEFIGEFNIISRERKMVQAEFRQNEVEVKFRHTKDDNDELDKFVQRKYRTDRRLSKSRQCFTVAQDDAMDCGFGAWRMHTVDQDVENELDTRLDIRRAPIPEAIRSVFFDSASLLADKSDARWCSVITRYDDDSYLEFLKKNGIEETGFISFDNPYQSIYEEFYGTGMQYPLYSQGQNEIYLLEFYEIEDVKVVYWLYQGIDADTGIEKINAIPEDEAKKAGFAAPFRKKTIQKKKCVKYITNGVDILLTSDVPGGMIPIIPLYGERNFVNGMENFYGLVKAAKDPQKLINAAYNYLTSLMLFTPVPKPVLDPREIEGVEDDWNDANNHLLAYLRKNKTYVTEDGKELPFVQEYTQPAPVPPAVAALLQALPALTDSILNPGVTEASFDSNMSGLALKEVKEQLGVMRYIFLDNWNESMRRDGEIYAAMLAETSDTTQAYILTNEDGTTTTEFANEQFFNVETMSLDIKIPLNGAKFNVYSNVGASYSSQRDASLENLKAIYATMPPGDPLQEVVMLAILSRQDGEGLEELKKVARFQLLGLGLPGIEAQTDEERKYMAMLEQKKAEAAQNPQPSPEMVAAQAMAQEAQAKIMDSETKQMDAQTKQMDAQTKQYQVMSGAENNQDKALISMFDAETKRGAVQVQAEVAGATIDNTRADIANKALDVQLKQQDLLDKEMLSRIKNMSTSDIINLIGST